MKIHNLIKFLFLGFIIFSQNNIMTSEFLRPRRTIVISMHRSEESLIQEILDTELVKTFAEEEQAVFNELHSNSNNLSADQLLKYFNNLLLNIAAFEVQKIDPLNVLNYLRLNDQLEMTSLACYTLAMLKILQNCTDKNFYNNFVKIKNKEFSKINFDIILFKEEVFNRCIGLMTSLKIRPFATIQQLKNFLYSISVEEGEKKEKADAGDEKSKNS